jgi:ATP-dependent helicase YprA (DUF1998 family)
MDIFKLRDHIVNEFAAYTQSFLNILDPDIREFVRQELARGKLWPDALVQLSPAYDRSLTVAELVEQGVLHPLCRDIFQVGGATTSSLHLYRHQKQAIDMAAAGRHYVVTTGTGSGKSLTYIIPIVNHILRNRPEDGRVRAIIVYPMNALINSQAQAINRFFANASGRCPVRFARYTGQESDEEKKEHSGEPATHPVDQLCDAGIDADAPRGVCVCRCQRRQPAIRGARRIAYLPRASGRRRGDADAASARALRQSEPDLHWHQRHDRQWRVG